MLITPLFQGWVKSVAALGCVALLAACGGGGGKSSTTNSVASVSISTSLSSAPSLSSASTISLSSSSGLSSASKVSSASSLSSLSGVSSLGISSSLSSLSSVSRLIGGSIQGTPLEIYTMVTTLAGITSNADGIGLAASFKGPRDVASDGTSLYVADTGNHKIRKIVIATGVVTTLAGSDSEGSADGTGAAASFYNPVGITSDGTNLYVTEIGNHKIRKIVIATGVVTTLAGNGSSGSADGTGTAASFYDPTGIISDGTNLYVADSNNQKIRKIVIATGVVTTLAGSSYGSKNGTGTAAKFAYPYDITSDGTNLYVTDTVNHNIRKIVIATGVVTTLAGGGSGLSEDGTGTAASFYDPTGIISDGTNLYVAETYNNKIRKVVIATGVVTTLASNASQSNANGTGTAANFIYPIGIASDGANLYITDADNDRVRKIVIATGAITTLVGSSSYGSTDGTGTAARFNYPSSITSDGTNLYVADTSNHKIRKIVIATGVVTTLAGSGSKGSADGIGTAASFNDLAGITNDGTNLYVADSGNNKIRKIVIATGVVITLAGSGSYNSEDGTGTAASFGYPTGITSDGANLYVAETNSHNIRKIVIATGLVTTLAGSGSYGSADGTGTAASFSFPYGITSDGTNLYVTDTGTNNIRKIVIATGVVTTLAGSGLSGNADGTGAAASFNSPRGITSDGTSLYVADTDNYEIRKIVIATGVVTTLAGSGSKGGADGIDTAASFSYPTGITSDGFSLFVTDSHNNTIRKIQ